MRIALIVGLLFVLTGVAQADPVDNNMPNLFEKGKALIESSNPRGGVFFNLENRSIQGYTSAKLLSKTVKGYTVDGVFGFAVDKTLLFGAETDLLAGISRLTGSTLVIPWFKINTGFSAGWSFEDGRIAYGPVVDASVKW